MTSIEIHLQVVNALRAMMKATDRLIPCEMLEGARRESIDILNKIALPGTVQVMAPIPLKPARRKRLIKNKESI